jgi:hypothetical protein
MRQSVDWGIGAFAVRCGIQAGEESFDGEC